jgi:hypothetical protein
MAAADRPSTPNLTFTALDAEEIPEPFVYVTKANHRVTFPDIFDMEAEEGQKFLLDVETKDDKEVLEKWLTKADLDALQKDKLTLRQRMRLMEAVMAYYQASLGTPGEGQASAS